LIGNTTHEVQCLSGLDRLISVAQSGESVQCVGLKDNVVILDFDCNFEISDV